MIPRLFLAKVSHTNGGWTQAVSTPPSFASGELADQAIVYSPLSPSHDSLPLALFERNENLYVRVLSEDKVDFERTCVPNQEGVIWMPTGGAFACCRRGFVLQDRNGQSMGAFRPQFNRATDKNWPDWRRMLVGYGISLLNYEAGQAVEEEAEEDEWPVVVLDTEHGEPNKRAEWQEGWINPLVIGYRHAGEIEGLRSDFNENGANDVDRAIAKAAKESDKWHLISWLGWDAMRRFVGWNAIRRTRSEDAVASRLTVPLDAGMNSSDEEPNSARIADLAALDQMGGRFEAARKPRGRGQGWRWRQPVGLDKGQAQLARRLARKLGLKVIMKPGPTESDVFTWRLRPSPLRRTDTAPLAISDNGKGILGVLEALSNSEVLGADAPTLRPLMVALRQEAEMLDDDIAEELFKSFVYSVLISTTTGMATLSRQTFTMVVEQFFAPQSSVLIPMTGLELIDFDAQAREDFENTWSGRSMDLFQSPGRAAADTLRAVVGNRQGAVEEEAAERNGWWSAFWRHNVAGDRNTRFRLLAAGRVFILDASQLDRAKLG